MHLSISMSVQHQVRTGIEGVGLRARELLAGKDARGLAQELLATTQEEFSAVFKNSPMNRAKLRGLKRNAAVVLGNVRAADAKVAESVAVLTRALGDPEALVRDHAAWASRRLQTTDQRLLSRNKLRDARFGTCRVWLADGAGGTQTSGRACFPAAGLRFSA